MKNRFPTNIDEAKKFQEIIAEELQLIDNFSKIRIVGGFDIAYKQDIAFAAGILYDCENHLIIEKATSKEKVKFPYIPTFLFLREVPPFLSLLEKFNTIPDIIIVDGHGIAHPRTAGSATVFGVISDIPSIGVAKKPLKFFCYEKTNQSNVDKIFLYQKHVGYRYSFSNQWNPIYISPGNKISIESSYKIVKFLLTSNFKLPIPQQYAHLLAAEFKKNF